MPWWFYALASALAAAATAILSKMGVVAIPSNLATAIRTTTVLVISWTMVALNGELSALSAIEARSCSYLVLSGLATGLSWLAYFKALQLAPASRVAPVDKLSLAFTLILAASILKEPINWQLGIGTALIVIGVLTTLGA